MKPVTIQDIAKLAGVSKSTVSRVLNSTTAVHVEKVQAVRDAAERLGFKPNMFARGLANGRSMTVGIVTQNLGSPFYDAIVQGLIEGLESSDFSPLIADGRWKKETELRAIQSLIGRRVDGLVLIGGILPGRTLEKTCDSLPRIVVARKLPAARHCCLHVDNVEGGYLAVRHLLESGHRKIAFIGGLRHHPDARDRLAGYRRALEEFGLCFNPDLFLDGDFSATSGMEAVNRLVSRGTEFTAIFGANDMIVYGARLALAENGIGVPDDVSLVGYDDQAESSFTVPPLTTIRQPARTMGLAASSAIVDAISGKQVASQIFHVDLQSRNSVVPP